MFPKYLSVRWWATHILVGSFCLTLLARPAISAGDPPKSTPIREIVARAEKGDPYYQGALAHWYLVGHVDLGLSLTNAFTWARLSADKGHPFGLFCMGDLYEDGKGKAVPFDREQANLLYRKCLPGMQRLASEGDAEAQVFLGLIYAKGLGGAKQDPREALKWIRSAADNGNAMGQYNLGCMLATGMGVAKDVLQAIGWMEKAVRQGHVLAHTYLGSLYEAASGEARAPEIVKLFRKAAECGEPSAQTNLGYAYERGFGVDRNEDEAVRWYRLAAMQGEMMALHNLASTAKGADILKDLHTTGRINVGQSGNAEHATSAPESLSIGSIVSEVFNKSLTGEDDRELAIRDQLTTELAEHYHCAVQMRAKGSAVSTEAAIESLKRLAQSSSSDIHIPVSDCVVGVSYRENTSGGFAITGTVFCACISFDGLIRANEFSARSIFDIPAQVAKTVAWVLALNDRKKPVQGSGYTAAAQYKWAVLPFITLGRPYVKDAESDLSLKVEVALQDALGAGRIVDRQKLSTIMAEQKLRAIGTSLDSQYLQKLVGADYFIMGQVGRCADGMRADIHVVDARTGTIVGARAVTNADRSALHAQAVEAVLDMLREHRKERMERLAIYPERQVEARLLTSPIMRRSDLWDFNYFAREMVVLATDTAGAEGTALLMYDDQEAQYSAMAHLSDRLATTFVNWSEHVKIREQEPIHRAVAVIDAFLESFSGTPNTPAPLLMRAQAHCAAEDYAAALSLLDQHLKLYPGVQEGRGAFVRGLCLWHMGKLEEGFALVKSAETMSGGFGGGEHSIWWLVGQVRSKMNGELSAASAERRYTEMKQTSGETGELAALKEVFSKDSKAQRVEYAKWTRYLELLEKFESPDNILRLVPHELLGKIDSGLCFGCNRLSQEDGGIGRAILDMWLLQARAFLKLGRKDDAARRAKDVAYSATATAYGTWTDGNRVRARAAQAFVDAIEKEIGPVEERWKTGAQTSTNMSRYSICIIPDRELPPSFLSEVCGHLRQFFGVEISCLAPFSVLPGDMASSSSRLDGAKVLQRVIAATPIPDNAIWVTVVTGQPLDVTSFGLRRGMAAISARSVKSVSRESLDNPIISSFHGSCAVQEADGTLRAMTRFCAWTLLLGFHYLYEPEATRSSGFMDWNRWYDYSHCDNPPCVFSSVVDDVGYLRIQMCPACQEQYRKLDCDKIHRDLMKTLTAMGATIVPKKK